MIKKLSDYLAGLKMTLVSFVFLIFSLISLIMNKELPMDPALVTVFISGFPLLYLAVTRLVYEKWISSALLISIAMIASLLIGEVFAAGEVAFIMAIGAILEDMTVARAKKGLSKLLALTPTCARRLSKKNGISTEERKYEEELIPAENIKVGDLLRVLPGEIIPVDGKIVSGHSSVDQSIMTGESIPVDKTINDSVYCGTMNCFGSIDMEASSISTDTSLQKLINMVKEAEQKKAPMQRIVDKWAVWLVPIALLIAIFTFVILIIMGSDMMIALNRGVTVLVVFCPCALALATPTSIMAAIGQATKHGVIIKSGEALEKMGKVDTIAFDKTGTLTHGRLEVSDLISFHAKLNEDELLQLVASAEAKSEHPLAKAIVLYGKKRAIRLLESIDFRMLAGKGISARVSGRELLCGSEAYLKSEGIKIKEEINTILTNLRRQGKATIIVASEKECIGVIALSDVLRPTSQGMVEKLTFMGVDTILLTGDNKKTAEYFAKRVGITHVLAELLPEEKVNSILSLQQKDKKVCMIGDGINDAPALKTADVGIAMGSMGSDIAVEAADIALMGDDISKIPYLKRLSNATLKNIKINITASMIINFIAVTMSVLGLLNPITGALVHNAGSVLIVLNAALLYDRKFDK